MRILYEPGDKGFGINLQNRVSSKVGWIEIWI